MFNRLVSIVFLLFFSLSSAVLFLLALFIWLCTVLFDRRLTLLHLFTSFWACIYLWAMPAWSVSVEGRDKIRKKERYIVVSNHQSQLDILVAFRLFFHFKWVSKAEVFKLPFIGWNMVLNRYIKIHRGRKESVIQMMAACEEALDRGSSVFFFPEGTRSRTGELRDFKPGAFILAHKQKLPILVIAINGTRDALPKHSLNFHGRHDIRIKVIGEIPYDDFKDLSVEATAAYVREQIRPHIRTGEPT